MPSTSMSKPLVSIKNLNLSFELRYHHADSLRQLFVNFMDSPFKSFFANRDVLHVLRNLNLEIHQGDRLGIIGVNGSGKTSLCRVISKMYTPNSGQVHINGEVRSIFDTSIGIQPELTGRENALLIANFMFPRFSKSEISEIVAESLEFSELNHFIDVPFKTYSKGMQARLCLSLISSKPSDVLILDEVFDGADTFFKEKISERVLKMIEKSGAVIFVSHSADQIEKACNRLIVLNNYEIVFDGEVQEGLTFYSSLK